MAALDSAYFGYEHFQDHIHRQEKVAGMYLLDFSAKKHYTKTISITKLTPYHKKEEKLVVAGPHTVDNPYAVMIHLKNTSVTYRT